MKRTSQFFIAIICLLLIFTSWVVVINLKSDSEKQNALIDKAIAYINDEIYILAVPLLEEAYAYSTNRTIEVENLLKDTYLKLINQVGYESKYLSILEKQMNYKNSTVDVFIEAANYYLDKSKYTNALEILKNGIAKTGDDRLINLYEKHRYNYRTGYDKFDNVTDYHGDYIGVQIGGYWGVASSDGSLYIPCEYEKISSTSVGKTVVKKNDIIYVVDIFNNRVALLKEEVIDFGNFSNGIITFSTHEGWIRANEYLELDKSMCFEEIGTYYDGYVAAKINGKWGIINSNLNWIIPAEYDGIVMDELGRSYAQKSAFIKKGESVYLFVNGKQIEGAYEDARPFIDNGYAAVKKNGKWGYINTNGELKIDYQFDDALSFSQHLAAVKVGDYWGYISLYGQLVIDAKFMQVKSFTNGSAPVLINDKWQFIKLLEYSKGASL